LLDKFADISLQNELHIGLSQFLIMLAILKRPLLSQQDIAHFLRVTPAAVSRQIELLRDKQLIVLGENKQNRREHVLSLTKSGQDIMLNARKLLGKRMTQAFSVLTAEEQDQLTVLLSKLTEALCSDEIIKQYRKNKSQTT